MLVMKQTIYITNDLCFCDEQTMEVYNIASFRLDQRSHNNNQETFIKSEGKEVEEEIFIELDNIFFVVFIYKEEME